jgi:peptidoglycan/LPS O-acetylase OafA/YrhL
MSASDVDNDVNLLLRQVSILATGARGKEVLANPAVAIASAESSGYLSCGCHAINIRMKVRRSEPFRVPALDGVRGMAFLIVLFAHTDPQLLPGGNFGVDLFFALSGFLITSILLDEGRTCGTISLSRFYIRRGLRLLPGLAAMVVAVLAYVIVFHPERVEQTIADASRIALYIFNWTLATDWQHIAEYHQTMYTHLWSLSIEEQFYLVWPWVVLGTISLRPPISVTVLFLAIGIAAPALGRALLWHDGVSLWMYFRTDLRIDTLFWGSLVAFLTHWGAWPKEGPWRNFVSWSGAVALVLILWLSRHELLSNGFVYRGVLSFVGFLSALLIAAVVWGPSRLLKRFLEMSWLRWVGRISYGLYLWHVPVLLLSAGIPNPWLRNLVGISATFAIASLSFYILELPLLRLKERFAHQRDLQESTMPRGNVKVFLAPAGDSAG